MNADNEFPALLFNLVHEFVQKGVALTIELHDGAVVAFFNNGFYKSDGSARKSWMAMCFSSHDMVMLRWLNVWKKLLMNHFTGTRFRSSGMMASKLHRMLGGNFTLNLIWEVCDGNYSREEYCCG